ncbi:hypothetical protein TNCV_4799301 [Trichonephila clavipes]|nr:hypothetical protein TNCV_4799301 [Trichonephila clavipes]
MHVKYVEAQTSCWCGVEVRREVPDALDVSLAFDHDSKLRDFEATLGDGHRNFEPRPNDISHRTNFVSFSRFESSGGSPLGEYVCHAPEVP